MTEQKVEEFYEDFKIKKDKKINRSKRKLQNQDLGVFVL